MYFCKHKSLWAVRVMCVFVTALMFLSSLYANHNPPAFSENQQADTIKMYSIDELVIVGGSRHREVIPAQRLSGEKLEALSSFSVADAIRYFSGVQIKDFGGIGGLKTINIRSMGTNHTGVFYDGIQLGNAQNGQIDLGKFSLDNMEEIALYNGQKSEIFQSAKDFGSAGSLYLRTRRPRFEDGKRTNITANFRTGSFHLINPSILWEQKINNNVASSINAEYVYSSGKYPFRYRRVASDRSIAWDTTAIRQNGDINSLRVEGAFNGIMARGNWHAKTYFYDSERGIPGAIVNNVWKHSQRQWDRNFFVQFSARNFVPTPEKYELTVNMKYANDQMRYLNPDTTLMYIDNNFRQQEIYFSVANKYSLTRFWDVVMSVDYQYNTLNSSLVNFVFPVRNSLFTAFATAFEWKKWKVQASILATSVFEDFKRENISKPQNKTEYAPAAFISFKPFERQDLNIRAFYKRVFRMPTFNDLYYTDVGNINLEPEYATQYNFGFQYERRLIKSIVNSLNISADAYYNEVTDKIVAIPKGSGQYRWMMMNLGYVQIRGIDFSSQIAWSLPSEFHIFTTLNYTFQKAQDFTPPRTPAEEIAYGGQIAYIPWHSGSTVTAIIWRSWNLNYSFIYAGERYHNSANIPANREQPWYTHDMAISKLFRFKKSPLGGNPATLKISAEINNIFDQHYDVVLNYPMPGRNYKIILKLNF